MKEYNSGVLYDTDAYKLSHYLQYPADITHMSFYLEARKEMSTPLVFFGLQSILYHLQETITERDVNRAQRYWHKVGLPFNYSGWLSIAKEYNGNLPVEISAVPEGTRLPTRNVLLQITNTHPRFHWLPGWLETKLDRVWYPSTVCTISNHLMEVFRNALEMTSDDPEGELPFKLHDFGSRGTTHPHQAGIGGAAHLVNFKGTDTGLAAMHVDHYYTGVVHPIALSIPAAEHSTITAWGREGETAAYRNMLEHFGSGIVAVVSDSYDIFNAVSNIWGGTLKDRVISIPGMLVVRPDSGDAVTIPIEVMKRLDEAFGHTINSKGFKVLNHVRVIQGDGLTPEKIKQLLTNMIEARYSVTNIACGMGGGLLQDVNRDTFGFAMKASAKKVNGKWIGLKKDPITDKGKVSKPGRHALIRHPEWRTIPLEELGNQENMLQTVYRNGLVVNHSNWAEVVKRANS